MAHGGLVGKIPLVYFSPAWLQHAMGHMMYLQCGGQWDPSCGR